MGVAQEERGSAAVLGLVLVGALTFVCLVCAAIGGAVVDQRRVAAAADLGALAAAAALQTGADACAAAAAVVARNGGSLAGCELGAGQVVVVRAEHERPVLGFPLTVSSRARAGPQRLEAP